VKVARSHDHDAVPLLALRPGSYLGEQALERGRIALLRPYAINRDRIEPQINALGIGQGARHHAVDAAHDDRIEGTVGQRLALPYVGVEVAPRRELGHHAADFPADCRGDGHHRLPRRKAGQRGGGGGRTRIHHARGLDLDLGLLH
jgi:hypothetical protein